MKSAPSNQPLHLNFESALYRDGQGLPQDHAEAAKWFRLAADQGNASAQNNLGVLYNNGQGVPQDFLTAHMWFNLGAANGNDFAFGNRDTIVKEITPADVSEAQRRARVCLASGYQDCD